MPTTTVHLPSKLPRELDILAARTKASRNRLMIEAYERLVRTSRGVWPPGFVPGRISRRGIAQTSRPREGPWSRASRGRARAGARIHSVVLVLDTSAFSRLMQADAAAAKLSTGAGGQLPQFITELTAFDQPVRSDREALWLTSSYGIP